MYKIYTSYFRHKQVKKWQQPSSDRPLLIPICRGLTRLDTDLYYSWYRELAPSEELLTRYNNVRIKCPKIRKWFTEKYLEELDELRYNGLLEKFVKEFQHLVKYNDVILLCYEKSSEFCHRHILASYLKKYYNLDILEY